MTSSHFLKVLFTLLSLVILGPTLCFAETRYVTDRLVISVRTQPNKNAKVLDNISTGTALTVLESQGDYLKVRVNDTLVGWVSKYYTEEEIPKAQVIESLNREIRRMEQETSEQTEKLTAVADIEQENRTVKQKLEETSDALKTLQEKYAALLDQSKDIVQTIEERDTLKAAASQKDQLVNTLSEENRTLKNYKMIYWFATGGGIFLLGWLIGKLSHKGQRRSLTL